MSSLVAKFVVFLLVCTGFVGAHQAMASKAASQSQVAKPQEAPMSKEYQQWLQSRFAEQHQQLIPIVAVADIYFGCNLAKPSAEQKTLNFEKLVLKKDRAELAEQLRSCLKGQSVQSSMAINYGLVGCFSQQFAHLSDQDKKQKMTLVKTSLAQLPKAERHKSFTKCVTEQAIQYLK